MPPEKKSPSRKLATRFEELSIWLEARKLANATYAAFRGSRDYAFVDQLQRSAVSVMNNIAEGFERSSRKDFTRFLDQARGASGEARSMLYLATDLGYLGDDVSVALRAQYEQLSQSIAAFTRHLRNSIKDQA